jgi:hypothetical protein
MHTNGTFRDSQKIARATHAVVIIPVFFGHRM